MGFIRRCTGIKSEKGRYYKIILRILGVDPVTIEGGVTRLPKEFVKGIYQTIPHYFKEPHKVDMVEFKESMEWALADVFGGGCEVDEIPGMYDNLDSEDNKRCGFCLRTESERDLSLIKFKDRECLICSRCLTEEKHLIVQAETCN